MSDSLTAAVAGCERLVDARVTCDIERPRQVRLVSLLISTPFLLGPALAFSLPGAGPIATTLSIVCAVFAVCWALAITVAVRGNRGWVEPAALALAALTLAGLAHVTGSLAPLMLAPAIALESYWVGRDRRAALTGSLAALAVVPLSAALSGIADGAGSGSLAIWLVPLAYALAALPRLRTMLKSAPVETSMRQPVETQFDLPLLRVARSGDIVSVSPEAAGLLGIDGALAVGSSLIERVHVADRVVLLRALDDADLADTRGATMRLRRAEGFATFSVRFAPDVDGTTNLLIQDESVTHDLRERLEHARNAVESLDMAKSRFLAAVSHELRTPLNSIIGFSDMMLHGMAGELTDSRQRDYAELIQQSGNHLLSVVNSILDVSKIESGTYGILAEPFDVSDAMRLCHSMMEQHATRKQLTFLTRARTDIGEIVADRRAVQQIVLNLVSNAIKFTADGGKVTVEATRQGKWLNIVVADTGIGMSQDDLNRIGRPFTQIQNDLTRQYEGTGLGLSLVKGLVRLHEGRMSIESAPGEGTMVSISLPADGPAALGRQPAEVVVAARPANDAVPTGGLDEKLSKAG